MGKTMEKNLKKSICLILVLAILTTSCQKLSTFFGASANLSALISSINSILLPIATTYSVLISTLFLLFLFKEHQSNIKERKEFELHQMKLNRTLENDLKHMFKDIKLLQESQHTKNNSLDNSLETLRKNLDRINSIQASLMSNTFTNVESNSTNLCFDQYSEKNLEPYLEIINTYNNNPGSLFNRYSNIVKVSESEDSVSQRYSDASLSQINLTRQSNFDYLVISPEQSDDEWLVPKANIKLGGPSRSSFEALFNFEGYIDSYTKLVLVKPSRVRNTGSSWQLVDKGEIIFES